MKVSEEGLGRDGPERRDQGNRGLIEAFSGNTYIDDLSFYADSFTLRGRTSTGMDDRAAYSDAMLTPVPMTCLQ